MQKHTIAATLISTGILIGCGGGSSTNTATPLTSSSEAPVAPVAASTDSTGASTGSPTELASSVDVSGYRSVSIAATTTSAVRTASFMDRVQTMIASLFIKPAYAQTAPRCTTDAYKLIGIKDDGSYEPLSITTSGTDSCNVGFREMFDVGSYILLTGEGIYKDDLTCNLVFLEKANGNMYCVGETLPSRYQIATSSNSNGSSIAEKIQTITAADGTTTKYVLINAQSTTFDSNNQISGLKTKLIRFDLTDTTAGPKAAVLLEGYQSGWSQYTTASEFEYFNLENYRLAQNGDVLTNYYRSIWNSGSTGSMSGSSYRRNLKYYYDFTNGGTDYSTGTLRDTEALTLINAALSAQAVNNTGATAAVGASANVTTLGYLNVSCMFDAPNSEGGVLMTTPSQSWISGYDSNGMYTSQWSNSSSLFRVTAPNASSAGKPVIAFVKPTLLCSDTSGWSGNIPQKVGDTWYTLQSAWSYSWGYNPTTSMYQSYGGTKTSIIGNRLYATTGNANDDTVFTMPTSSNDLNGSGGYYWGAGISNTRIRASKDYLYLINQGSTMYTMNSSSGVEISRFKPADQTTGSVISNLLRIVSSSQNLSYSAFTTTKKDNVAELVARDLSSDDLDKVYGTIAEDGNYSQRTINNSRYSTVAVARLN